MIIFDGLFSFVSVILSSLSLGVYKIIQNKKVEDLPFSKYILEPIIIGINGIILIIMCLSSLRGGIDSIRNGGNTVELSKATIYSIISTVGSIIIYLKIKKEGKKINSELINMESIQWKMDGILSGAVLVGFLITFIISKTKLNYLTNYIDPTMVIITSVMFLKAPIQMVISNLKEIMGFKVPENINLEVIKQAEEIKVEYNFNNVLTKVLKIGRSIKIEVDFIGEDNISKEIKENIKTELYYGIKSDNYYKDMNVAFNRLAISS
ncbi:cation transporter [Clostridium sp.]|uniref:cation transporter n=1 Tax=Clostridium sp. TaxID=1506 RepID=UPI002609F13C|nr:cation transporter [Clostridium sp.]